MYLVVEEDEFKDPSVDDIRNAIRKMDNENLYLVTLSISDEDDETPYLLVGGGKDGMVNVGYFSPKEGVEAILLNQNPKGEIVKLQLGGVLTELNDKDVVSKEDAIIALEHFLLHQELTDQLKWDVQVEE